MLHMEITRENVEIFLEQNGPFLFPVQILVILPCAYQDEENV